MIGADGITLDLNGHTVDGDGAGDHSFDFGIDNTAGHDHVTIKRGSIRQFVEGVEIDGATDNIVRDLAISHQGHAGMFVFQSTDIPIRRTRCLQHRRDRPRRGIGRQGQAQHRLRHRVRRNTHLRVRSCVGGGQLRNGQRRVRVSLARYRHKRIRHNRIERNDASDNPAGILLEKASAGNVVVGKDASENSFDGVSLDVGTDENLVTNNLLRGNGLTGVFVVGSDDNRIERNAVIANGDGSLAGIYLFAQPDEPGITADHNVISKNLLIANDGDGILVDAGHSANVIEENRASENIDDGINVDSPATTLTRNTANRNHDLGIDAVPGVTDGGGNRAAGNGNPMQCTHVLCG